MMAMLFFQHDPIAIEDNFRYDINFLTSRLNEFITLLGLFHTPPQFTPLEIISLYSALYPAKRGTHGPEYVEGSQRLEFLTGLTLIYLAIPLSSYKALSQFLMMQR